MKSFILIITMHCICIVNATDTTCISNKFKIGFVWLLFFNNATESSLHHDFKYANELKMSIRSAQRANGNLNADFVVMTPNKGLPDEITGFFKDEGVIVVEITDNVDNEIDKSVLDALESFNNCCGAKEYLKLETWRLTQYDKIFLLDSDILFLKSVDALVQSLCNYRFAYTAGGFNSPLNGGMLVIRPNFNDYRQMKSTLATKNIFKYWKGNGTYSWNNEKRVKQHHGMEGPQGFFHYYFSRSNFSSDVEAKERYGGVTVLDKCIYNFQTCRNWK